jgi:flagellar basal-body rod protein FlgC
VKIQYLTGMNVSASGLAAQRRQMDVAAENLANVHTTSTPEGGPYRRKLVSFEAEPVNGPDSKAPLPTEPVPLVRTQPAHRAGARILPGGTSPDGVGVSAREDQDRSAFPTIHDPGHPDADPDGNVQLPNVDMAQEMVTLMAASRAYEANVAALRSARSIAEAALDLMR